MYQLKTKATTTDPLLVIAAIPNEKKQVDAKELLKIFQKATGKPPVVWGTKMIGFGSYRYRYATGHQGEIYTTGFSVTKAKITLYLYFPPDDLAAWLKKLGKATAGKSCIYVNKLADIDTTVLKEMIVAAVSYVEDTLAAKA